MDQECSNGCNLSGNDIMVILDDLYHDHSLSSTYEISNKYIDSTENHHFTYGELTLTALSCILSRALKFHHTIKNDFIFYDLGSGIGKQILSSILLQPKIKHAIGIEIVILFN